MTQNKHLKSLRERVETALTNLDGKYNKPEFIDYFFTPIEKSTNATMEFAKLVRDIKINAPAKWTEFIAEKMEQQRKHIKGMLSDKYGDYVKQSGEKYEKFLILKMESHPQKAREIYETLKKGESPTPPAWEEFLEKYLDKNLLERLEKVRKNPQFPQYFQYKKAHTEKWKHACASKPLSSDEQKSLTGQINYTAILEKDVYDRIIKQLYFVFEENKPSSVLKYLERDLEEYEKRRDQQQAKDQAAREQAVREQTARDQAAREHAAREAREQAAREHAAREARDQVALRDQLMRDQNARDSRSVHQMNSMNSSASQISQQQGAQNNTNKPNQQKPIYHPNGSSLHPVKGQQDTLLNQGLSRQKDQYIPHLQSQSQSQPQLQPQGQGHHSQQLYSQNTNSSHNSYPSNEQQMHQSAYHQQNGMIQPQHGSNPHQNSVQSQSQLNSSHHGHQQQQHPPSKYSLQSPTKPAVLQSSSQPQYQHQPKNINQSQIPSQGLPGSQVSGGNQYQHNHQSPQTMSSRQPMGQTPSSYTSQNAIQHSPQAVGKNPNQQPPSQPNNLIPNQNSPVMQVPKNNYQNNYDQYQSQSQPQPIQQNTNGNYQPQHTQKPHPQLQTQPPQQNINGSYQSQNTQKPNSQLQSQPQLQPQIPPQPQSQSHHQLQSHSQASQDNIKESQNHKIDPKRGRIIEKEKFAPNFNFESISIDDGQKRLGDVYRKLKNPFGNFDVIDRFTQSICAEMNEIELQERVEKKMKTNPIQHKEIINMLSTEPKPVHEQNIVPVNPPVVTQYITSIFDAQIQDIKRDLRFKVEEKGNFQNSPSLELTVFKTINGIPSSQFRAVFMLFKDATPKIRILDITNCSDFYADSQDQLNEFLVTGGLKQILELWLEFIDKCSMKTDAKLNALDELFDF